MKGMSGPGGHQHTHQTRFQIASRLGGFRNTVTLSCPFGTGATFTIRRKGSAAHREWAKSWLESDPMTSAMLEEQILGEESHTPLTEQESLIVDEARKEIIHAPLIPIIDRLVSTRTAVDQTRTATKKALASGRVTLADLATNSFTTIHDREEALFLLKSWDKMPDADGDPIPHSREVAEELLLNDTPLTDAGLDDVLLSVPCWRIEVNDYAEDGTEIPRFIPRTDPSLLKVTGHHFTLGRAYQLWLHWASEQASHFRDKTIEAAAKNSVPPSDPAISSGGGTSSEEPASS